jgi:hypothetical protein
MWFSGHKKALPPTTWWLEFPIDITAEVIPGSNPDGMLTNSDLEMASVLLHYLVLEGLVHNLTHQQAVIGCDNLPAVSWTHQTLTYASLPVAHWLL